MPSVTTRLPASSYDELRIDGNASVYEALEKEWKRIVAEVIGIQPEEVRAMCLCIEGDNNTELLSLEVVYAVSRSGPVTMDRMDEVKYKLTERLGNTLSDARPLGPGRYGVYAVSQFESLYLPVIVT